MNDVLCLTCRKPKAAYSCGLCSGRTCKGCAHFTSPETFSFLPKVPKELSHSVYCSPCYDAHVYGPLRAYEETMEKARDIIVFSKDETKKTGHLKRKEQPYQVTDVEDEQEAVMRLAFFAVRDGFNCLLDVQISHRKIIVGSHKKTVFSATAIPITIASSEVREY